MTTLEHTILGNLSSLEHRIAQKDLTGYIDAFLVSCQINNLSPYTIVFYQENLGYFLKFLRQTGLDDPGEITVNHIRLYILACQKTCKPVTVATRYRAVKRFFNWLADEGLIDKTPVKNIKLPKIPDTIIKPFTQEEVKRMLSVCENNYCGIRNRAMLMVFLDTGLRLREMAEIELKDVSVTGLIKVMGKGAKERFVRMSDPTMRALMAYRKLCKQKGFDSERLWLGEEGQNLVRRSIEAIINRICERAAVKGFTEAKCSPHTFRHTSAVLYLHNGGDTSSLQTLLGHSTAVMTRHYARTGLTEQAIKVHEKASPVKNLLNNS